MAMELCSISRSTRSHAMGCLSARTYEGLPALCSSRIARMRPVSASATENLDGAGAGGAPEVLGAGAGFRLEPTRKLREKKMSDWSVGTSPGEYGGPPLESGIRKMWGGAETDPLAETDEYIWQKNWQPYVNLSSSETDSPPTEKENKLESGFLSLNRSFGLDSLDVDLSNVLNAPSKISLERQAREARNVEITEQQRSRRESPKWRFSPTKREEIRWTSARKAATGGSEKLAQGLGKRQVDPVVAAEVARKDYVQLKRNLQYFTLAIGGMGIACAYTVYSPEVAGSYGAGLLGALVYVRLLGNSVDSLGSGDARSIARGVVGQPRLLVPVVLVMLFNRWNALVVPEYNVTSLQLIPMLVGFFTYKAAALVEVFMELLPIFGEKRQTRQ